jgi:hypothetical protein
MLKKQMGMANKGWSCVSGIEHVAEKFLSYILANCEMLTQDERKTRLGWLD